MIVKEKTLKKFLLSYYLDFLGRVVFHGKWSVIIKNHKPKLQNLIKSYGLSKLK